MPDFRTVKLVAGGVGLPPMLWLAEALTRRGVQVDRDAEGSHFFDLTSAASGENALEARRSDNARAVSAVAWGCAA